MENKNITIYEFVKKLSSKNKELLDDYIKFDYISGIRTGKGKRKNFFEEYNSPEGIKVLKEILKFKRLEEKIIQQQELIKKNKI